MNLETEYPELICEKLDETDSALLNVKLDPFFDNVYDYKGIFIGVVFKTPDPVSPSSLYEFIPATYSVFLYEGEIISFDQETVANFGLIK